MYQMLLPTPIGENVTYYFFTDPYDECPQGGLGENVNSTVYGYVTGPTGSVINGSTISVGGYSTTTDSLEQTRRRASPMYSIPGGSFSHGNSHICCF